MVLAKSCKLVPVMLMNVLLYRRKFAPHKYLVVALVTIGITMFMGFGNAGPSKKGKDSKGSAGGSVYGLVLLLINLAMDGATNSTQDEIFSRYKVTGQQMMFWLNLFGTVITTALITLPLPYIPIIHESTTGRSEFLDAIQFLRTHPSVVKPIVQFAFTGALGQLFIFETLQHFGSLTLVYVVVSLLLFVLTLTLSYRSTITLTRKLFTMILSVIVYKHKLTLGQWSGAAVVFAGIGVEAWVKRKGDTSVSPLPYFDFGLNSL
jgi:UDP-galactose transporter B1